MPPCPICSILACQSGHSSEVNKRNNFRRRDCHFHRLSCTPPKSSGTSSPSRGNTLLDICHCLIRQLIRFRRPNEFHFLINNEVVHYFVLPNLERTSLHNHNNWIYQLEGQGEKLIPPQTPPTPEYHHAPLLDVSYSYSSSSAGPFIP